MENPFTRGLKDPETGKWDPKEIGSRVRGAFAVLLSLAVLIGGGWFVAGKIKDVYNNFRTVEDYNNEAGTADVVVVIPPNTSLSKISDILVQADVVKTAKAFDRVVAGNEQAKKIQAGQYKLRTQIPAKTALEMLLDTTNMIRNRFQIPEGLRYSQILPLLVKATGIKKADFEAALKDRKGLGIPSWMGKSNEGFLFPDTYELPAKPTAKSVLKVIVDNFNRVTHDAGLEVKAKDLGLTPYQALTLASLVEREASRDDDRPKVARVFLNRLDIKMALQSDATVAYANNITGRVTTTPAERKNPSPYNTYLHPGLPPGPITAPAKKALEATLNPADGNWKFFVVVNLDTGETDFNADKAGHDASVQKFRTFCQTSDKC